MSVLSKSLYFMALRRYFYYDKFAHYLFDFKLPCSIDTVYFLFLVFLLNVNSVWVGSFIKDNCLAVGDSGSFILIR